MKRRNFIQALLGTAAIAPLLPLLAKTDPPSRAAYTGTLHVPAMDLPTPSYDFSGMQYHIANTGTYQGLSRSIVTEADGIRLRLLAGEHVDIPRDRIYVMGADGMKSLEA